jgi:hypothetical protein
VSGYDDYERQILRLLMQSHPSEIYTNERVAAAHYYLGLLRKSIGASPIDSIGSKHTGKTKSRRLQSLKARSDEFMRAKQAEILETSQQRQYEQMNDISRPPTSDRFRTLLLTIAAVILNPNFQTQ